MSRASIQYTRLMSDYYEDEAIGRAGIFGELMFVRSLAYCSRALTDGYISPRALTWIGVELDDPLALAARLVAVGLWQEDAFRGGWVVRNWLKYNWSADEIEDRKARDRERKRTPPADPEPPADDRSGRSSTPVDHRSGRSSAGTTILPADDQDTDAPSGRSSAGKNIVPADDSLGAKKPRSKGVTGTQTSAKVPRGIPTDSPVLDIDVDVDVDRERTPPTPRKRGAPKLDVEGFAAFYDPYPRHESRQPATRAWSKLSQADRDAATAGAIRLAARVESGAQDPTFVPHPSTFLNQRRWEDEPVQPGRHLAVVAGQQPARIATTTQRVSEIDALREKMLRGTPR